MGKQQLPGNPQHSPSLRHYYRNSAYLLSQERQHRMRHKVIVDQVKSQPCADCGKSYPPFVMDFDHVRGKKHFQVGGNLHLSTARILAEIAKCDMVCSNCHRYRTFTMARKLKAS